MIRTQTALGRRVWLAALVALAACAEREPEDGEGGPAPEAYAW